MTTKTKLRTKLEALAVGRNLRVDGITKSGTDEYNQAYWTIRNLATKSGRKFKAKLGANALIITRVK